MSSITINQIQGTGIYAVPTDDASNSLAKVGLTAILSGVANFSFKRTLLFVASNKDASPYRYMNLFVDGAAYLAKECPNTAETAAMFAAIEAALLADPNISTLGTMQASLFPDVDNSLWQLNYGTGDVTLVNPGDKVAAGQKYSSMQLMADEPMPFPWVGIDFSSTIGTGVSRVWLIFTATAENSRIVVRRKGDSGDFDQPNFSLYANVQHTGVLASPNTSSQITCMTDSNGVIQYRGAGRGDLWLNNYSKA